MRLLVVREVVVVVLVVLGLFVKLVVNVVMLSRIIDLIDADLDRISWHYICPPHL